MTTMWSLEKKYYQSSMGFQSGENVSEFRGWHLKIKKTLGAQDGKSSGNLIGNLLFPVEIFPNFLIKGPLSFSVPLGKLKKVLKFKIEN